MKTQLVSLVFAALALTVGATASAQVRVDIGINPFIYGEYPPPVVYQPEPYYYPPPVVYYGRGTWGGHRHGHDRRRENYDRRREDYDRRR